MLPELVIPQNANDAAILRKILGLDVLVWGSYLAGDSSKIWLNVEQKRRLPKEQKDDRKFDAIFGVAPKLDRATFSIEQADIWDSYISFMLVVMQAVNARSFRTKNEKKINWRSFDSLYYANTEIDVVVEYLIWEVLRFIPFEKMGDRNLLSTRQILVEIAGNWVGQKLMHLSRGESVDSLALELLPVAQLCTKLAPDIAENHYRLGTIYALLGQVDQSVESFGNALQYETPNVFAKRTEHIAEFQVEIDIKGDSTDKLSPGRLAAYIARFINIDGEKGKAYIQKTMENEKWLSYWRDLLGQTYKTEPIYRVLLKLVSKEYNPRRSNKSFIKE